MDTSILKNALSSNISAVVPDDVQTKHASVLVLIYGTEPKVIMTEKPKHLNIHAGEIAFPGGKWNENDHDLLDTALRETDEEIGLNLSRQKVTGQLENVRTLNSGFTITPFISIIEDIPQLKATSEVEHIFHIPLIPFLKTLADDPDPRHNSIQEMYTFTYQGKIVWGASARILKQIVHKLRL
ncbi:MAG: CoA pyrophosphatase [Nitrosopumilaceae archaeon]